MRFRFYILILLLSILLFGCKTKSVSTKEKLVQNPLNTILIEDNLYVDKTEISFSGYQIYNDYLASDSTFNMMDFKPIASDLKSFLNYIVLNFDEYYFDYRDFPIVGISKEQAIQYLHWRSERVLEGNLIENKKIKINQDPQNYFTIKGYFEGRYSDHCIDSVDINLKFAVYTLPTKEEWSKVAQEYNFLFDKKKTRKHLIFKPNKYDHDILKALTDVSDLSPKHWINNTFLNHSKGKKRFVKVYLPKPPGAIKHIFGNVAEMVLDSDLAFGGSYNDSLDMDIIWNGQAYEGPQSWLGFRGVCRYMTYKEYLKTLPSQKNNTN